MFPQHPLSQARELIDAIIFGVIPQNGKETNNGRKKSNSSENTNIDKKEQIMKLLAYSIEDKKKAYSEIQEQQSFFDEKKGGLNATSIKNSISKGLNSFYENQRAHHKEQVDNKKNLDEPSNEASPKDEQSKSPHTPKPKPNIASTQKTEQVITPKPQRKKENVMFESKKTLIVVYNDELLMNQLRKLVETSDDEQEVVGTKDDSINIVSWSEKVWLDNKKAGNIQGKILFLGDIKGTDKLIPVLDIMFDDCGVKFGWAGNQAVLYADTKVLTDRVAYDAFLEKLSQYSIPEILKVSKTAVSENEENDFDIEPTVDETETVFNIEANETIDEKKETETTYKGHTSLKKVISSGADLAGKFGNQMAVKTEEVFRNKSLMKQQMLFYGIINMYNDSLEQFMNM